MDMKPDEKQEILETIDVIARMEKVSRLLAQRIEVLRLSAEIGKQTKAALDERQREVLLREQMAAIQRQLGEGEEGRAAEVKELSEAITKAGMPKEVEEAARKELRRFQRMPEAAAEAGMVRTYLDWLIELPWTLPKEMPIDIVEARRILDEDHFGLDKIKRRIVEFLAVRKLAPYGKAPILCFVGPPGVGKTSLGQSIARAMNRKFVRVGLAGYTVTEKREIARRYLVRRQMEANGLKADEDEITDAALSEIIVSYTREAGVRNLEREIGKALRHAAVRVAEGERGPIRIDRDDLVAILGAPPFESELAMRTSVPGVATGLAWTPVGGDILFIEATRIPGSGKLILTGQLGEVMKESAQAALSIVKHGAATFDIEAARFDRIDIHIHVPAGATPKDGPSAGVAMFMALVSLMTERTVRSDTAMTGEISLRGLVLPVGGIKEKVVAAHGAGIRRVMLPARNRKDFDDIPEEVRKQVEFVWLERVEQAVAAALDPIAEEKPLLPETSLRW